MFNISITESKIPVIEKPYPKIMRRGRTIALMESEGHGIVLASLVSTEIGRICYFGNRGWQDFDRPITITNR